MKTEELVKAIQFLRPTAEFTFNDDDYSTITWISLESDAPTKAELEKALETIKANEKAENDAKDAAKKAAENKLASLGLTADDLKALGLG